MTATTTASTPSSTPASPEPVTTEAGAAGGAKAAGTASPASLFALMRETQAPRQELLAERARWLRGLGVEGREELLFEFEVLLRGVERSFSRQALGESGEGAASTRDLRQELLDVHEALDGALGLSRRLLDPDSDQKFAFRRFVESQLTDDRQRRLLLEEELAQETPQESLGVLRQSFTALKVLCSHLLQLSHVPVSLFIEVGTLATREVLLNRYFRPFRPLEFRPEYDRIPSVQLLEHLRGCAPAERNALATAWLALFRIWRCLESIPPGLPRRSRVVFAVVRSEVASLSAFLTGPFIEAVGDKRLKAAAVKSARQLLQETERELAKLIGGGAPEEITEALRALTETHLLALARAAGLDVAGGFEALTSETGRAERLRRDLWIIGMLARGAALQLRSEGPTAGDRALEGLRRGLLDFEGVSHLLLRFGDMPALERCAAVIHEPLLPPGGRARRERMARDCEALSQVAEATFTSVSRRAQLRAASFDRAEAETLRDAYLE